MILVFGILFIVARKTCLKKHISADSAVAAGGFAAQ
jgi:hypothetical protein